LCWHNGSSEEKYDCDLSFDANETVISVIGTVYTLLNICNVVINLVFLVLPGESDFAILYSSLILRILFFYSGRKTFSEKKKTLQM